MLIVCSVKEKFNVVSTGKKSVIFCDAYDDGDDDYDESYNCSLS